MVSSRFSIASRTTTASCFFRRSASRSCNADFASPAPNSALRQARLKTILKTLPVLPFDAAAAETYGQIMAQIGWTRRQDFDRLIGAHALASGCTLVTANTADFSDIPGLIIEDWTLAA